MTMRPLFLDLTQVLLVHKDQIERYGGDPGIKNLGLLQSAVAMPSAGFEGSFLHKDLFEMAAAYLYHITRNHPFVDGNKRTGAACALVFLELNGIEVQADEDELVEIVTAVAEGTVRKEAIEDFFRRNASPGSSGL